MTVRSGHLSLGLLVLGAGGFFPAPVVAQLCTGNLSAGIALIGGGDCTSPSTACPLGCGFVNNCLHPQVTALPVQVVADPMNHGQWLARLSLDVVAPWNQWATTHNQSGTLTITWLAAASFGSPAACPPAVPTSICHDSSSLSGTDHAKSWIENPVTCAGAPYNFGSFSARVSSCGQPCNCTQPFPTNCICGAGDGGPGSTWQDMNGLSFVVNKSDIPGCTPSPEPCTDSGGGGGGGGGSGGGTSDLMAMLGSKGAGPDSGAAGTTGGGQCRSCIRTPSSSGGGGCSASVGAGSASCTFRQGGAHLHYFGGGVGSTGFPGTAAWQTALGRFWSHDYAERIVMDLDESHVWLLTRGGGFRELGSLGAEDAATHLRKYGTVTPGDEYRTLYFDVGPGSPTLNHWLLKGLDGSTQIFHAKGSSLAGLWKETRDRLYDPLNPAAHPAVAGSYNGSGQLTAVTFPDGRNESFSYYASGRLQSITENGVGGGTRTWTYQWGAGNTGLDITSILRPDGTHWDLLYGDASHPGFITRVDFKDPSNTGRIDAAFTYDAIGNVTKQWRGDVSDTGPNATDLVTYSFDNPALPAVTTVTRLIARDPVNGDTTQTVTYELARDPGRNGAPGTRKLRVTKVTGDCPTCGNAANAMYTYDANQPMMVSTMKDAKNTVTAFTYDSNGRVLSKTEAQGLAGLERMTTWTYDTSFPAFAASVTGPYPGTTPPSNPRQTVMSYDGQGNLAWREIRGIEATAAFPSQPAGTFILRTEFTGYSAAGQPGRIDPPTLPASTNDATDYDYNVVPSRFGFLPLSRKDPVIGASAGSPKTFFEYDAFNRRTAVVDLNGVRSETQYFADAAHLDKVHFVVQRGDPATSADDLTTEYQYNGWGDMTCIQYPRGNAAGYEYDFIGRLVKTQRKAGCAATQVLEETEYQLDAVGHRIAETRRHYMGTTPIDDATTSYTYATSCHLDKITQPNGTVTEYAYDCNNNLEKVWDASTPSAGRTAPSSTTNGYDFLNRLTSVTQPWTGTGGTTAVTFYQYDAQDHLKQVTDAENNITQYVTSDRDLLTSQLSPVTGTTTSSYDAHGNLTRQTDARSIVATQAFDDLDRVQQRSWSDGTANVTYVYDGAPGQFRLGRLASIAQGTTLVSYSYDAFGRMTQDGALSYAYDANGNRRTIGYGGGLFACYGFDDADRQSTLSLGADSSCLAGAQSLVSASSHLAGGPLGSLTLGNGVIETHTYDQRSFPIEVRARLGAADRLWWTLAYGTGASEDKVGNIKTIVDNVAATTRTYNYQKPQYFLTQGDGPWGTRSWTYDRIGNRLSETRSGVTDTYTYLNGHNPKLQSIALGGSAGTQAFLYDPAGNELVNGGPASHLDLSYDASNRLTRTREALTGAETVTSYDGRNFLTQARQDLNACNPIVTQATYDSSGTLLGRKQLNLFTNATLNDAQVFYFAGRPVAIRETAGSTTIKYVTVDHLGTPILLTDGAGASVWSGGFEPFGRDFSNAQAAGEFLRFPGQWDDRAWSGNDMFYNVARWYLANRGRYVNNDPAWAGYYRDMNGLLYVGGNPLVRSDHLGRGYDSPPSPFHGKVLNFSNCGLIVYGEPFYFQGSQIFPLPAAKSVVQPGTTSPIPDVDFVCLKGTWYKVYGGTVMVTSGGRLLGFTRPANDLETRTWLPPCTEGCLCENTP